MFVTSEGTEYGSIVNRFRHACERGDVFQAEQVVREMHFVSLEHALRLVCTYAEAESPKFEPAAVKFLGRLSLEGRQQTISSLQLAAAALAELRGQRHDAAVTTLLRLV